jgi:hypothetical protein
METEKQVKENVGNLAEAMRHLEGEIALGKDPAQIRQGMSVISKAAEIAAGLYLDCTEDRMQVVAALELVIEAVKSADSLDNVVEQFSVDLAVESILDGIAERVKGKHKFPAIFELYRQGVGLMTGWVAQGRLLFGRGKTYFTAFKPSETELRRVHWMTRSNQLSEIVDLLKDSPDSLKA